MITLSKAGIVGINSNRQLEAIITLPWLLEDYQQFKGEFGSWAMDVKPTSIMNYDLPPRYLDDGQNNDIDWKMSFDVAPECPTDKPYLRLVIFKKSALEFFINIFHIIISFIYKNINYV